MRRWTLLVTLLVAGCSSGPPQTVTWDDFQKPEALSGKTLVLEGYPGILVPATNDHKGEQCFFLLDRAAGRTSSALHSVEVLTLAGSGPNQTERLPDGYSEKDLKVHCRDGAVATTRDKIRVQGRARLLYNAIRLESPVLIDKVP